MISSTNRREEDSPDRERISLDKFYSDVAQFNLSDGKALEYMSFSAKLSSLKFGSDAEMLQFKSDFQAALAFIKKLDDVDTEGVEPLGNVLEFYGGNEEKMQSCSTSDS